MRGAVHAHVSDLGLPCRQLRVEVLEIGEAAPGNEVALDVLHPRLDLALGLGSVRAAQPHRKAPVVGERRERVVQARAASVLDQTGHHGSHPVVQQRLAGAAEVLERALVRRQQARHAFVQIALGVAASAVPERHHEHMDLGAHATQRDGDLAPIDLGLLARGRLEAHLRHRGHCRRGPQRAHRHLHQLVAAGEATLRTQLLEQDPSRVADLRRPSLQPLAVRIEHRRPTDRPLVRRPVLALQAASHRLAIQLQLARDRRHPLAGGMPLANLLPLLLTDHVQFRVPMKSGHGTASRRLRRRRCRAADHLLLHCFHFHLSLLCEGMGGEISNATGGDYWSTADSSITPRSNCAL